MTDKTELTREEVEALLAGATPGPWGWIGTTPIALYSVPMQDVKHAILAPDDRCISRVNEQGQYVPLGSTSPDARLIAAAPTIARQLLATMDAADEDATEIEHLKMVLDEVYEAVPDHITERERSYSAAVQALAADRSRLQAELAEARATLAAVLAGFTEQGHPGRPCVRHGWVSVEQVEKWRAALTTMEPPDAD